MPARLSRVLEAFESRPRTISGAGVERDSVLPEKMPVDNLIILRGGDPGEREQMVGSFERLFQSSSR